MKRWWEVGVGLGVLGMTYGALAGACTRNPGGGAGGSFDTSGGFGVTSSTRASTGFSSTFATGVTTGTVGPTDSCGKYFVDTENKSQQCGIPTSGGAPPFCMSTADQVLAECLDKCLPLMDCGCAKDPSGPGCASKLAPFSNCNASCNAQHGTTSSTTSASVTVSAASTSATASSTGPGSSSSSGGNNSCTTGTPGTHGDSQCDTCWGCASDGPCQPERTAFMQAPSSASWIQCVEACPTTPASQFQDCVGSCDVFYPGVDSKYLAFEACAACQACATDCNSTSYYGNCSQVAPF